MNQCLQDLSWKKWITHAMIALSVDGFDVKCLLREDEGWSPDVRLDQNATFIAEKAGFQLQYTF